MWKRLVSSLLFSGLFAVGCATTPHTPPVVVPPPGVRLVQATIQTDHGTAPDGSVLKLVLEKPDFVPLDCPLISSRMVCRLDDRFPLGEFGAHVLFSAPEYDSRDIRIILTGASQDLPEVVVSLTFTPLPQLTPDNDIRAFRLPNGQVFYVIEATEFNLYARWLDGEDINPVLDQIASAGFNFGRVWTSYDVCRSGINCQKIGFLRPSNYPNFYTAIPEFLRLTARYGIYVEFTAFAGPYQTLFDNIDQMVDHWNRFIAATTGQTGVIRELVNEGNNGPNLGLPYERLLRPHDNVPTSHGSNAQDSFPVEPIWDWAGYRPAGGEWWRKPGHNAMEVANQAHVPIWSNEMTRCCDQDADPNHFVDAAATSALLAYGFDYHTISGKSGELWTDQEFQIAKMISAAMRAVPLKCVAQPYRNLGETDLLLRNYQRGGDPDCIRGARR